MDDGIIGMRAPTRCTLMVATGLLAARQPANGVVPRLLGDSLVPVIQQSPLRGLDRSHGEGREYRALVFGYGHTLFSLLIGGADVPQGEVTYLIEAEEIVCTISVRSMYHN